MKKYIRISTWNGEGYSDSMALVKDFNNEGEVIRDCQETSLEYIDINDDYNINNIENGVLYIIGDDAGVEHYHKYNGEYGIMINPCVNGYTLIETVKGWNAWIEDLKKDEELDPDDLLLIEDGSIENYCFHSVFGGDAIFIKL